MSTNAVIRRATPHDVEALATLFDAYRRFYEQPADLPKARAFIGARLGHGDSVILVAEGDGTGIGVGASELAGFTQLYPTFCSVEAAPIFVLYDLFVDESSRRAGVARALMRAAEAHARATGAARMDLSTARTNAKAQSLYESLGWRRDDVFLHYSLSLV